jgi:hypothetical protein
MAGLRGVEPPTTWFVARCSIQLSYRPAETTHAFPLDYDTLPATSTASRKSNSPARSQCPVPRHSSFQHCIFSNQRFDSTATFYPCPPRDKSSLNVTSQCGEAATQAGVELRRLQEAYGEVQDATQRQALDLLERAVGIEPTSEAWKASVLPLYDARSDHQPDYTGLLQNSG